MNLEEIKKRSEELFEKGDKKKPTHISRLVAVEQFLPRTEGWSAGPGYLLEDLPGVLIVGEKAKQITIKGRKAFRFDPDYKDTYALCTGEGNETVPIEPGDWIVTYPDGKRKAVKPDVFEKEYEPVEE